MRPKRKRVPRAYSILTSHVDQVFEVHNGRQWVKVRPSLEMVGLKYGEFAKTRTPRSLQKKGKKGK